MVNDPRFHSYPSSQGLLQDLVVHITNTLVEGIKTNGQASLAVSGGSTPVALFQELSVIDIGWEAVTICLVDERWVSPDSDDSNEKLVRSHLLQNHAAKASFVGMKNEATTAVEGVALCHVQMEAISKPFDFLILGLGPDGHTASLFPDAPELQEATDMQSGKVCTAVTPQTAPHGRMTLTLPAILNSHRIFLHITGEKKREVLEKALQDGPDEELPIRYILNQDSAPFKIYWAP